eukprot:CAMPEP_0170994960 /NCGR_PEP_ID=MMETSP0736-20130129/11285_1 /TAXON_ID=186038 /ORGANISM="Fragilariopsis kerguelensis, Strain L26-C5" /LENGTH=236 /DNA_ID=CAMNT_0011420979 /DNA_START=491 /DNA_END=1201 /DNA_ORIENTATION=+
MKNKKGKTIAKSDLPSKVCLVCERPFTWRKKWERNWDEVTTCSKSCNAKRKSKNKTTTTAAEEEEEKEATSGMEGEILDDSNDDDDDDDEKAVSEKEQKKVSRKQRKEAVKLKKQQRRLKREGKTSPEVGRKACDVCTTEVDMLIRCTIDATQSYKMVCGKCWTSVSGGITDGNSITHPYYTYGGVWKNRNASPVDQKKRIGNGSTSSNKNNNKKGTTTTTNRNASTTITDDDDDK